MSSIEKAINMMNNEFSRSSMRVPDKVLKSTASNEEAGTTESVSAAGGSISPLDPGFIEDAEHAPHWRSTESPETGGDNDREKKRASDKLTLPKRKFKSLGMITADEVRSQVAEEYRSIKRPVLSHIKYGDDTDCGPSNIVMVASCVSGEGKTYSAINLAMTIAMEPDKHVLLVDADVAKASATALLGASDSAPGLIDVLQKETLDIRDVIIDTDMDSLQFMSAGVASDFSTELLASQRMSDILSELSTLHSDQVVVIDSAPLLLTNEASVLADKVGQVVFVVAAESTSQQMVADGVSRLNENVKVGMILNKVRKNFGRGYGYGYGYGYGHQGEQSNSRYARKR